MSLLESIPQFLSNVGQSEGGRAILGDPNLHKSVVEVVEATGKREKRRRRFTACLTVYLVLGLSLFRRLSVPNVLVTLVSGLRDIVPGLPFRPGSEASACEARYAPGVAPLRALFAARAAVVSPPPKFYGLRVWAIDGVRILVPDTTENDDAFGRPESGRGNTAYPVVRVVALVDTYGHRVKDVDIGHRDAHERKAVRPLIERLGDGDVATTPGRTRKSRSLVLGSPGTRVALLEPEFRPGPGLRQLLGSRSGPAEPDSLRETLLLQVQAKRVGTDVRQFRQAIEQARSRQDRGVDSDGHARIGLLDLDQRRTADEGAPGEHRGRNPTSSPSIPQITPKPGERPKYRKRMSSG